MMKRRRAITLVEILVVVGILIVLAAITFAVMSSASTKGKESASLSNVRQLSLASSMYLESHGAFPKELFANPAPLLPLVKTPKVFACPLDPYRIGANPQASLRMGSRVSYYWPVTLEKAYMDAYYAVANPGIVAGLHFGERTGPMRYGSFDEYRGRYLLGRADGSVKFEQLILTCKTGSERFPSMDWWSIFVRDHEAPDEVMKEVLGGERIVPCRTR
jgi:type II secretory pathway pseudopilin PulG